MLRVAAGLPFLVPVTVAAAVAVSSVSLSRTSIGAGNTVTASVALDGTSSSLIQVSLFSSNTSVATVPHSIDLGSKFGSKGTFTVTTVAGSAGCSSISAKLNTGAKSALLYVEPPVPATDLKLTLNPVAATGGNTVSGTLLVIVNDSHPGTTVQLNSNTPLATVPSSVSLTLNEMGVGTATFNIGTTRVTSPTCAVITATHGGTQSRVLLKINPLFVG